MIEGRSPEDRPPCFFHEMLLHRFQAVARGFIPRAFLRGAQGPALRLRRTPRSGCSAWVLGWDPERMDREVAAAFPDLPDAVP